MNRVLCTFPLTVLCCTAAAQTAGRDVYWSATRDLFTGGVASHVSPDRWNVVVCENRAGVGAEITTFDRVHGVRNTYVIPGFALVVPKISDAGSNVAFAAQWNLHFSIDSGRSFTAYSLAPVGQFPYHAPADTGAYEFTADGDFHAIYTVQASGNTGWLMHLRIDPSGNAQFTQVAPAVYGLSPRLVAIRHELYAVAPGPRWNGRTDVPAVYRYDTRTGAWSWLHIGALPTSPNAATINRGEAWHLATDGHDHLFLVTPAPTPAPGGNAGNDWWAFRFPRDPATGAYIVANTSSPIGEPLFDLEAPYPERSSLSALMSRAGSGTSVVYAAAACQYPPGASTGEIDLLFTFPTPIVSPLVDLPNTIAHVRFVPGRPIPAHDVLEDIAEAAIEQVLPAYDHRIVFQRRSQSQRVSYSSVAGRCIASFGQLISARDGSAVYVLDTFDIH